MPVLADLRWYLCWLLPCMANILADVGCLLSFCSVFFSSLLSNNLLQCRDLRKIVITELKLKWILRHASYNKMRIRLLLPSHKHTHTHTHTNKNQTLTPYIHNMYSANKIVLQPFLVHLFCTIEISLAYVLSHRPTKPLIPFDKQSASSFMLAFYFQPFRTKNLYTIFLVWKLIFVQLHFCVDLRSHSM